ncbi:MAG: hypothetical protein NVS4B9_26010 [Ktedonobacteraceae bacterium]
MWWSKLQVGERLLLEKGHEMQQIVNVSRKGIGGTPACGEMPYEVRNNGDRLVIVV